jgi:hypothetical protein
MQDIDIKPMGPHEYAVVVTEGQDTTHHKVRVTEQLVDDLGVVDLDEANLVRQSFEFLLEREPGDAILREFDLAVISRYFGDYLPEMRARLLA